VKPIDALTGLPRSPDVARVVATQGRQGEVQAQEQVSLFSREMKERQNTVNEAQKTEGGKVDAENAGEGGGAFYDAQGRKRGQESEKESVPGEHPSKGKILDIRGS
jgi:hypothetical protein